MENIIEIDEDGNVHELGLGRGHWIGELTKLEKKRVALHHYIELKLEERDYHAIADCAMDLRELDARSKAIKEWVDAPSK